MCEYINENQCLITKEICPFVYFCNKQLKYLPLKSMPKRCKVIMNKKKNIPEGYNAIEFVRGNYLYVKIAYSEELWVKKAIIFVLSKEVFTIGIFPFVTALKISV